MKTILAYLKNKTVSHLVLGAAILLYAAMPSGWPFVELAYAAVGALGVIVAAPLIRLFVFHEVAEYAESGQLDRDLKLQSCTPALRNYWFATFVCYLVPLLCIATISK